MEDQTIEQVPEEPKLLRVRATVSLPDLPVGSFALVDPTDPYIIEKLDAAHLVPV